MVIVVGNCFWELLRGIREGELLMEFGEGEFLMGIGEGENC